MRWIVQPVVRLGILGPMAAALACANPDVETVVAFISDQNGVPIKGARVWFAGLERYDDDDGEMGCYVHDPEPTRSTSTGYAYAEMVMNPNNFIGNHGGGTCNVLGGVWAGARKRGFQDGDSSLLHPGTIPVVLERCRTDLPAPGLQCREAAECSLALGDDLTFPRTPDFLRKGGLAASGDFLISGGAPCAALWRRSASTFEPVTEFCDIPGVEPSKVFVVDLHADMASIARPDYGTATVGAVHLFAKDAGGFDNWGHVTTIPESSVSQDGRFGTRVILGDNVLVIQSVLPAPKDEPFASRASLYVFEPNPSWNQVAHLVAPDSLQETTLGGPITMGNGWFAAATYQVPANPPVVQSVEIFHRTASGLWEHASTLESPPEGETSGFGSNMSGYEDTLAVSSFRADSVGVQAGEVFLFRRSPQDGKWIQEARLVASDGDAYDYFGSGVLLTASGLLVGARNDDDYAPGSGSAYLFERVPDSATSWREVAKLTPHSVHDDFDPADCIPTGNIYFGGTIALSDRAVIMGAGGRIFTYSRLP